MPREPKLALRNSSHCHHPPISWSRTTNTPPRPRELFYLHCLMLYTARLLDICPTNCVASLTCRHEVATSQRLPIVLTFIRQVSSQLDTDDAITYRATGPYRALSCHVIGLWTGLNLDGCDRGGGATASGEWRLHQIKACWSVMQQQ